MAAACVFCNESLADGLFCPSCGSRQPPAQLSADPFIGRVVAERYEIIDLVDTGGMGRVYRAVQRALDRVVAIKIVQPTTTSVRADEVVARFMMEARTASRLNHPNVVSIFDFGRVSTSADAELFLAMEFLAGPSLRDVIAKGPELSFVRIADILRQTLAALGEAHHLGITHRDVKPDNIVIERLRGEGDHVKVIDFGIAKVHAERPLTDKGRVMGTPDYIAPEHAAGAPAGPSVDLYAVGVILFELLTGRVPFEAPSPIEILQMHASAPRPDPRLFAPTRGIPPALVDVCFRALAIDPADRYANAESLARAIAEATAAPWTTTDARLFPSPTIDARKYGIAETIPPAREGSPKKRARAARPAPPPPPATAVESSPLVGRDDHVAWLRDQLQTPRGASALVLWGRTGMGRTRILHEAMAIARELEAVVLDCASEPAPRYEVGYTYLRALVSTLAGAAGDDGQLRSGVAATDPLAGIGLRALFALDEAHAVDKAVEAKRGVIAAVRWAARRAVERAGGAIVVVALDDVDRADGISRAILGDFVEAAPIDGLLMIMTCEARPAAAMHGGVRDKQLLGLSREDAKRLVARTSVLPGAPSAKNPRGRRIEPLYLEQYLRWRAESRAEKVPAGLVEIVGARLHGLAPVQRRVLQAVAVVGSASVEDVARLLGTTDGVAEAITALVEAGFLAKIGAGYRLAHAAFARGVLNAAPSGVVEQLHARAAEALESVTGGVELRAHHAIRARPDFEAFMLLEECARIRTQRGDDDGAIAALSDGYSASRTQMVRGDAEAASSAWSVFGRKLAAALLRAGHVDPAHGVLTEILEAMGPRDAARVPVCEHLALIAEIRDRQEEAERWRREARSIASETPALHALQRIGPRNVPAASTFRRADSESSGLRPSYTRVTDAVRGGAEEDDLDEAPPSNRSR